MERVKRNVKAKEAVAYMFNAEGNVVHKYGSPNKFTEEMADILEGKSHAVAMDDSGDMYEHIDKDGVKNMLPNMVNVQSRKLLIDSFLRLAGHRNSLKYGRIDRAILAEAGDINIQIVQYGDKKELPGPGSAAKVNGLGYSQLESDENIE